MFPSCPRDLQCLLNVARGEKIGGENQASVIKSIKTSLFIRVVMRR